MATKPKPKRASSGSGPAVSKPPPGPKPLVSPATTAPTPPTTPPTKKAGGGELGSCWTVCLVMALGILLIMLGNWLFSSSQSRTLDKIVGNGEKTNEQMERLNNNFDRFFNKKDEVAEVKPKADAVSGAIPENKPVFEAWLNGGLRVNPPTATPSGTPASRPTNGVGATPTSRPVVIDPTTAPRSQRVDPPTTRPCHHKSNKIYGLETEDGIKVTLTVPEGK